MEIITDYEKGYRKVKQILNIVHKARFIWKIKKGFHCEMKAHEKDNKECNWVTLNQEE